MLVSMTCLLGVMGLSHYDIQKSFVIPGSYYAAEHKGKVDLLAGERRIYRDCKSV